ncbi:thioredoxin [Nanoarchaeota archaeon]|nr:MAG: thioredoxin [Nanoarchaeota archaeon]
MRKKVLIQIITSPTCPYCPLAVEMAERVSKALDVDFEEVSVATQKGLELARKHGIMGVPAILINGKLAFEGVPPSDLYLARAVKKEMENV